MPISRRTETPTRLTVKISRAELAQLVGALIGEHDADQEREQADDRQRVQAGLLDMADERGEADPAGPRPRRGAIAVTIAAEESDQIGGLLKAAIVAFADARDEIERPVPLRAAARLPGSRPCRPDRIDLASPGLAPVTSNLRRPPRRTAPRCARSARRRRCPGLELRAGRAVARPRAGRRIELGDQRRQRARSPIGPTVPAAARRLPRLFSQARLLRHALRQSLPCRSLSPRRA